MRKREAKAGDKVKGNDRWKRGKKWVVGKSTMQTKKREKWETAMLKENEA